MAFQIVSRMQRKAWSCAIIDDKNLKLGNLTLTTSIAVSNVEEGGGCLVRAAGASQEVSPVPVRRLLLGG